MAEAGDARPSRARWRLRGPAAARALPPPLPADRAGQGAEGQAVAHQSESRASVHLRVQLEVVGPVAVQRRAVAVRAPAREGADEGVLGEAGQRG